MPASTASYRPVTAAAIRIRGARQNNLRNLSLDIALNKLTVVSGVSGSGKSSLVFDTLYAEGQRRYVETFSPYARQFLERMDKPRVDRIEGVPPAIAIDQAGQVRTSRSTVGTMTELADHFKLLYARAARLYCPGCGSEVKCDSVASIAADLRRRAAALADPRLVLCFALRVPANFSAEEVEQLLVAQGYHRIEQRYPGAEGEILHVVQDRFRISSVDEARLHEGLETALARGQGRLYVHPRPDDAADRPALPWAYSTALHCASCDLDFQPATPGLFSFNSPIGACENCRGFGRIIGVDHSLVIPDESKTLAEGAVKPWQSPSYQECQDDLARMARKYGVAMDVPVRELPAEHRQWLFEGDPKWKSWDSSWPRYWYGIRHFFVWLESRAYKMHIRVLLSRYRSYTECPLCKGARLKPEALRWRLMFAEAGGEDACSLSIDQLMALPASRIRALLDRLELSAAMDEAFGLVRSEIRSRLDYLLAVGLGYLSLDRQSRTLSGGEVQRINLTTALGTSLVNTLFVLDEPSIGLHPRDIGRILEVMQRLRDAGNTLVVVEHDPQVMLMADEMIEIGPGPGERGGNIVARGQPAEVAADPASVSGPWLSGSKQLGQLRQSRVVDADCIKLWLRGASQHNLRNIDVGFPLQRLVCVTGVSGSGKSTLLQDVLYPALSRHFGVVPAAGEGEYRGLENVDKLAGVVMVDQSPIGKSSRFNPVSYVGAWDAIRALFAALPAASERGYSAATFSFNSGQGRCPHCNGSGFEHVEMQFLADVWLRCEDCDGRRYRPEVLELKWNGHSVADVLELTVGEALALFAAHPKVLAGLAPLADVGLDYLRLGQPVPTLSGGEAQRLKLAGHLASAKPSPARRKRSAPGTVDKAGSRSVDKLGEGLLFLFDEPTTGLHFEDIARLVQAFDKLLAVGHSVVVIEHNLDLIAAADWIIDLGPEGGEGGGELVVAGSPAELRAHPTSHTARALREQGGGGASTGGAGVWWPAPPARPSDAALPGFEAIEVRHAREHNLKDVSVRIPRDAFTVITGLSGSGKSTLAFDIIYAEGQRRYLESLNAYARQFVQPAQRAEVDGVFGIPPTVAIEQRSSRGGRKSTVATLTEIHPFLRLLYARLGTQYCPRCEVVVEPQSLAVIVSQILDRLAGASIEVLAPLVVNRKGLYSELAKWARGKGHDQLRVDGEYLPTAKWPRLDRYREHSIELPLGMTVVKPAHEAQLRALLEAGLEAGKGVVKVLVLGTAEARLLSFSTLRACPDCGTSFPEPDPKLFSYHARHGWCEQCYGTGLKTVKRISDPDALDLGEAGELVDENCVCPACAGARLNAVARAVRFREQSIDALARSGVDEAVSFFADLTLSPREADIGHDLVNEIRSRLAFLQQVGLGYLALDRAAPTLSGGEAQRIRLAAQLGSSLRGVCYVLDEPTIGLHPRDNQLLLDTLQALRAHGNTLLVVEHDEETIRRADHIIDLGPGAGIRGGEIVAEGDLAALLAAPRSLTGQYLRRPLQHPLRACRSVSADHPAIEVVGACLHNLRALSVRLPLGRLNVITGVSGSGKSTLAREVIYRNLRNWLGEAAATRSGRRGQPVQAGTPFGCRSIEGWEQIGRVLEVDQTPIGKTPRSCPATYVGFWDAIRRLFADTFTARTRGWNAARFSFNTGEGRCPQCKGAGQTTVEMNFLPDVRMPCEACAGTRFNADTLSVHWKGKNIADVLAMSIDDAVEFFAAHPAIAHPLQLLQDVGLGYLSLGQPSPTLSGGEAQRIKLVTELAKVRPQAGEVLAGQPLPADRHTLYVLDEPTVGLHMADVARLITVLHRLADSGHTVLVIEHDLDVIAEADWLIDLGPEGGRGGGELLAAGELALTLNNPASHTGRFLAEFFAARSGVR